MIPFEKLVEGSLLDRFLKELSRLKMNSKYLADLAKRIHTVNQDKVDIINTNV
jgi:hypothetical protein